LFDEHASVVLETIDALAERQRMLGAPAEYSLSALRERSALPAEVGPLPDTPEMLRRLLVGHRVILEGMRQGFKAAEAAEDPGTADLFARFLQAHEKMEWFLRELMT
jgi:DNA-binding ferritin-like protein